MNNEEKLLKQNKTLLIFIIILLLVLIGLITYFAILNNKKEEPPKEDNTKIEEKNKEDNKNETIEDKPVNKNEDNNKPGNNKEEKSKEVKNPTKEEIIDYIKITMKNKNLSDEDNIEEWTFDTVQLEGYFKKDKDTKYYAVIGKFKCKEGTSCVYQDQLDDPDKDGYYKWSTAVKTKFEEDDYKFLELTTTYIIGDNDNPFIEVWEDIE